MTFPPNIVTVTVVRPGDRLNAHLFTVHQDGRDKRTDAVDRVTQQAAAIPHGDPIVQATGVVVQFREVMSD